ncbi:hypothetical protein L249_4234 [Ophiocordyceps polyrhachis-furcata BCC 54312]|uniref:NEDD8-activating enzyme E1 regulatory subunit n=1 Tax=Ophiocordyceps polyrhachis-furcata BCC 54312 TaxID=1330021 RepID=A0A367L8B8_9HYPO|nr:hypothetical protein L249_4234 [Ophiocordyceps polyrhachis-furcata BCC 54312]
MASDLVNVNADVDIPPDKDKKYDRQLRLWAASGQTALEHANVLLVNSGGATVGVETLKNLVLPGIGSFTIIDEAIVSDEDLGVNFFLDESDRGKSRAQCCMNHLLELNPGVRGSYYPRPNVRNVPQIFDDSVDFTRLDLLDVLVSTGPFSIILYVLPLRSDQLAILQTHMQENHTPSIAVQSVGLYSYFHVLLPGEFPVVETHPDEASTVDLRLLSPWPELVAFTAELTSNIDELSEFAHGHLPLVVILLHYLSVWRDEHDSANPVTYSDKVAFRSMITNAMRRNNAEGGEENFEEAISSVMKLVKQHSLPASLEAIFERCDDYKDVPKSQFWTIVRVVKQFYSRNGQLPLPGSLPDMKAESAVYRRLQKLYKEKAQKDLCDVLGLVRTMAGGDTITKAEVELFCKNARFIKLVNADKRTKLTIDEIIEKELAQNEIAANAGYGVPASLIPIYLALTAIGQLATMSEDNILSCIVRRAPALTGVQSAVLVCKEASRFATGELHNISALTAGMVAQEMIKIITRQYVPIDNVCIYDGIESRCHIIQL